MELRGVVEQQIRLQDRLEQEKQEQKDQKDKVRGMPSEPWPVCQFMGSTVGASGGHCATDLLWPVLQESGVLCVQRWGPSFV